MKIEEIYKQALAEINYVRTTIGLDDRLVFSITTSPLQIFNRFGRSSKITIWQSQKSGEVQKVYDRIIKELALPSEDNPQGQYLYIQVTSWD